jgi:hypothetical protein
VGVGVLRIKNKRQAFCMYGGGGGFVDLYTSLDFYICTCLCYPLSTYFLVGSRCFHLPITNPMLLFYIVRSAPGALFVSSFSNRLRD